MTVCHGTATVPLLLVPNSYYGRGAGGDPLAKLGGRRTSLFIFYLLSVHNEFGFRLYLFSVAIRPPRKPGAKAMDKLEHGEGDRSAEADCFAEEATASLRKLGREAVR